MVHFIESIAFAYSQIRSAYFFRLIMGVGSVVTLFWAVFGYYAWDGIVAISGTLIEFTPFSFVKSDSATLLSAFFYMQTVLVTFALIYAFIVNLHADKKSGQNRLGALMTLGFSAFFWGIIWLQNEQFIHTKLEMLFNWLPFETVETTLSYLLGFYIVYTLINVSTVVIASLASERYLRRIAEEEYPDIDIYDNEIRIVRYTLRDVAVYFALSLLLFPLLFVPLLNIAVYVSLWVWLVKDTLAYDAAALLEKSPSKEMLKSHRFAVIGIAAVGSLFSIVPIINLFGPFFSEIAYFYYLKRKKEDI